METISVQTKEQLKELYDSSAMTWEGLRNEDFEVALNMCGQEGAKGYVTLGEDMNRICKLMGTNAYPNDLTIFSIKDFKGLAIQYGARWMDDIIDNNARREKGRHPFGGSHYR